MKVSAFVPLLLSSVALATSSRRSHNTLSSRQAHAKRGLVDVCVALDIDVQLLDILPGGKPLIAGHLDLCLCLSILPDFCKSNSVAQNVSNALGGEDNAHDYFYNLIQSQPNKQQCQYPDHCSPICDITKPCGWSCTDGFVSDNQENPTTCVCPAPNTVCNGKCGNFPHGCSSQASKKKRAPTCATNKTLCGVVAGSTNGRGYDCVDTQRDLESCGGCVIDNPFDVATKKGKDCTAIPNVADVKCLVGVCDISACNEGFQLSSAGDACV